MRQLYLLLANEITDKILTQYVNVKRNDHNSPRNISDCGQSREHHFLL